MRDTSNLVGACGYTVVMQIQTPPTTTYEMVTHGLLQLRIRLDCSY